MTDPDAAPSTTIAEVPSGTAATAVPVQSALPSNMPSRIFSATSVDPSSSKLSGYTLISILFDQALNWGFVAGDSQAIGQLFRYMPPLLAGSLGIDGKFSHTPSFLIY